MGSRGRRFRGAVGLAWVATVVVATAVLFAGAAGSTPTCAPADALLVTAGTAQTAGSQFSVTVQAVSGGSCVDTAYAGTVHFTSTSAGVLPPDSALVDGEGTFDVTLTTAGVRSITATSADETLTGSQTGIAVASGPLDHFVVGNPGTQTAGGPFSLPVSAYDAYDNLKSDNYVGAKCLTFTGAASSPSPVNRAPDFPAEGSCTAPTSEVTFAAGAASPSVTLYNAASTSLSVADGGPNGSSGSFTVDPAALASFTAANPGQQTAGAGFGLALTAYDEYSNVKTNHTGAHCLAFSGAAASPAPTNKTPDYPVAGGCLSSQSEVSFAAGVASPSVTLYNAAATSLSVAEGASTGSTGSFTVVPNVNASLAFSDPAVPFNGEPVDTKAGTPVYHKCVGPAAVPAPCALSTPSGGSLPLQVLVRDAWSNRSSTPTNVSLEVTGTAQPLNTVAIDTANGVASYHDPLTTISPATLGTYTLTARSGALSTASRPFQLVADVVVCGSTVCESKANAGKHYAFGRINAQASSFDPSATLLTNQFFAGNVGNCAGTYKKVLGQDTEVRPLPQNGLVSLQPTLVTTTVALIIPKSTLQSSGYTNRNVNTFQVCVGAQWIDTLDPEPLTGWLAKQGPTASTLVPTTKTAGYFWGWAPDCSALTAAQKTAHPGNPCIVVRTKNASELGATLGLTSAQVAALPFKSSDFAVVVSMGFPWDGYFAGP